jgi:hypothetical protein
MFALVEMILSAAVRLCNMDYKADGELSVSNIYSNGGYNT